MKPMLNNASHICKTDEVANCVCGERIFRNKLYANGNWLSQWTLCGFCIDDNGKFINSHKPDKHCKEK